MHQRSTLGFTGRRTLISRQWSMRTLADVRADNRAWVRAVLAGATDQENEAAEPAEANRYRFELARPGSPGVAPVEHRLLTAISQRIAWRAELQTARRSALAAAASVGRPDVDHRAVRIALADYDREAAASCDNSRWLRRRHPPASHAETGQEAAR